MVELSELQVGQTVELNDGRDAVVRFAGSLHFTTGDFVGVELDEPTGLNDGSVKGKRYFECKAKHGQFVKPNVVAAIVDQPTPKPSKPVANGASRPRPQSMAMAATRRQSVMDSTANKRQSLNAGSPTPAPRPSSTSRSLQPHSTSPTKQLGTHTSGTSNKSASGPRQSIAGLKSRTSIAGKPSLPTVGTARPPRQSIAGVLNGPATQSGRSAAPAGRRATTIASTVHTLQNSVKRPSAPNHGSRSSQYSGHDSASDILEEEEGPLATTVDGQDVISPRSPVSSTDHDLISPKTLPRPSTSPVLQRRPPSPPLPKQLSLTSLHRQPTEGSLVSREVEDLKGKLRIMERKRAEDREKLQGVEDLQAERDKFENIIQRLQAKYQPQQKEVADLRRQLKEAEAKADASETAQVENDTVMEMAALDKEMAEETAESLRMELDGLEQKYEELELEADILREENAEFEKGIRPEDRASHGWIQMEKSNERLREALLRLRDVTQEQETKTKQEIRDLEKEVQEYSNLKAQHEVSQQKLLQTETTAEELRSQLDTALGAEDLIEELSDKNQSLLEQLANLRAEIEELSILKELNDELELGHVERERELQEDIDYQESILQDQVKKAATQVTTIDELEYTVTRFRELVSNMQSDLEDMRASQQITEAEANELTSRSRNMMDLNIRLQVSATKAQTKAIELELRQLETQELAENLQIVQHFLPDLYAQHADSVGALLRLKRIAFKSNVMYGLLKEKSNGLITKGQERDAFMAFDIMHNLKWVAETTLTFAKFAQACETEEFTRLGSALYEMEPVERALNTWIEDMKSDNLNAGACASDLQRSIALVTHLTELHVHDSLTQHAEGVRLRAILMHTDLENAAQAVLQTKSLIEDRNPAPCKTDPEHSQMEVLLQKADAVISQIRSAKVVCTKAIHQIHELNSRSLTLSPLAMSTIDDTQVAISEIASATVSAGISLLGSLGTDETIPITYARIVDAVSPGDILPLASLSSKAQHLIALLQAFYTLTNTLSQTVEIPEATSDVAPWEVLAGNLRAEKAASAQYEHDATRLRAEVKEKNTSLAMKDKVLDEMTVNMEVLERRMGDSGGRRERIRELEGELELARTKTRDILSKAERLERDLKTAESERESWRKQASEVGLRADTDHLPQSMVQDREITPSRALEEIEHLKVEISILQSTIRHLRLSAHQATISSAHSFLATPLMAKPKPSAATLRSQEARDVLNSMLQLVTHPQSQLVQLRPRAKEERLSWRPMRDTPGWQVSGQKELWASWKEWRDDAGQQMSPTNRGSGGARLPFGGRKRRFNALDGMHAGLEPRMDKESMGVVDVVGSVAYEGKADLVLGLP